METNRIAVNRITDYVLASVILQDPVIEKVIYEDGATFNVPDIINEIWVGIRVENIGYVGCYRLHQMTSIQWQAHAYILPKYRKDSLTYSNGAIEWCFKHVPNLQKITTIIPEIFPNIEKHVISLEFRKEGTYSKAFMKDGKAVDMFIYSLNKDRPKYAEGTCMLTHNVEEDT